MRRRPDLAVSILAVVFVLVATVLVSCGAAAQPQCLCPCPTPTPVVTATPTPAPTPSGACASLSTTITAPGGKFPSGYADSVAIAGGKLYVREAYGISVYALGSSSRLATWDLEGRIGYTRTGDGQQTVSAIGASDDGARIVAAWKTDNHGTLVLDAASRNLAEWAPPRALGGVGVVTVAGRYVGLSLAGTALWAADLSRTGILPRVAIGPGGGVERSLVTSGRWAAYVTLRGDLVIVRDGASVSTLSGLLATSVGIEGDQLVVGTVNGRRLVSADGSRIGSVLPLPGNPQALTLLNGVAWSWVGSTLYREATPVLSLDPSLGPVLVTRGSGSFLYAGTGRAVAVISTTCGASR